MNKVSTVTSPKQITTHPVNDQTVDTPHVISTDYRLSCVQSSSRGLIIFLSSLFTFPSLFSNYNQLFYCHSIKQFNCWLVALFVDLQVKYVQYFNFHPFIDLQ